MRHIAKKAAIAATILGLVCVSAPAYAAEDNSQSNDISLMPSGLVDVLESADGADASDDDEAGQIQEALQQLQDQVDQQAQLKAFVEQQASEVQQREQAEAAARQAKKAAAKAKKERTDKVLSYDKKDIAAIGTQEETGHTICCPSFSCAYADAVLDGTVHDHSYYTCSNCTWNDWGGGGSWNRSVGSSEELLREAYDQIASGKPTVIHVAGYGSGEHWICLIGYKNAEDPDHLTLENFVALDPWDGKQITASERYSLYGDGCEHISTRAK